MQTKHVMIIDDELSARNNLRAVIEKFEQLEIIAEIADGKTAISEINRLHPDIVFLDIEMPEVNGFDVANETKHLNHQLVFVTAYDKYAFEAFDTNAIDYLLKPVRPSLIEKCIQKILHQEEIVLEGLEHQNQISDSLTLSDGKVSRVIKLDHISHIEGLGRYRRIHLSADGQALHNQTTVISDTTLDAFDEQLSESSFIRVHRSYLVNTNAIINIKKEERRQFVTVATVPEPIPISRSKYPMVREIFNSK